MRRNGANRGRFGGRGRETRAAASSSWARVRSPCVERVWPRFASLSRARAYSPRKSGGGPGGKTAMHPL